MFMPCYDASRYRESRLAKPANEPGSNHPEQPCLINVNIDPEQIPDEPLPADILPREIVFNKSPGHIAYALLPWLRKNRHFRTLCVYRLLGLTSAEMADKRLLDKVRAALTALKCTPVLQVTQFTKIWFFPDQVVIDPDAPVIVSRRGFTEDRTEPLPQPFQIDVARAWFRVRARLRASLNTDYSTEDLRKYVTAWTKEMGTYVDVVQTNEFTGETYKDPKVYITSGAFLQAAIDEGYQTRRVQGTPHAHLNIAYKKHDGPWHGRAPKPVTLDLNAPKGQGGVKVRSAHVISAESVEAALKRLLEKARQRGFKEREYPYFTLKEASQATGVPIPKGRGAVPKVLREALKAQGCIAQQSMIKGVIATRWCRVVDMPTYWTYKGHRGQTVWAPRPVTEQELDAKEEAQAQLETRAQALVAPLGRFLDSLAKADRWANRPPIFTLPQIASFTGVPTTDGALIRALALSGCQSTTRFGKRRPPRSGRARSRDKTTEYWCRPSDMPAWWQKEGASKSTSGVTSAI